MNYSASNLVGFVSLGHFPPVPAALPPSILPVMHYKVAPKPGHHPTGIHSWTHAPFKGQTDTL